MKGRDFMYTNVAYLNNSISVVKDTRKPLIVTSCGYYRVDSGPIIKTNCPFKISKFIS